MRVALFRRPHYLDIAAGTGLISGKRDVSTSRIEISPMSTSAESAGNKPRNSNFRDFNPFIYRKKFRAEHVPGHQPGHENSVGQ